MVMFALSDMGFYGMWGENLKRIARKKGQPETEQTTEKTSGYIWEQEDILCKNNWKSRLKDKK